MEFAKMNIFVAYYQIKNIYYQFIKIYKIFFDIYFFAKSCKNNMEEKCHFSWNLQKLVFLYFTLSNKVYIFIFKIIYEEIFKYY